MTVVAGDILRTSVNFTLGDGSLFQNIYHHKRTGVGIIGDASHVSVIEFWVEAMYGEIDDIVSDTVNEGLCSVDKVEWVVDTWEVVENIGTFTPTIGFSSVAEPLPNQMSAFVVFKTNRPKTVGRKFLFPFTEAEQSSGILSGGTVTKVVAYADDAVNNLTLQVGDYLVPGVVRTGVDEWWEFYVAIVTDLMGTQRRRRPGYGA